MALLLVHLLDAADEKAVGSRAEPTNLLVTTFSSVRHHSPLQRPA
jgi:hypothetical protein